MQPIDKVWPICLVLFEDVLSCSFFVPRTVLIDTSIGRKRKT